MRCAAATGCRRRVVPTPTGADQSNTVSGPSPPCAVNMRGSQSSFFCKNKKKQVCASSMYTGGSRTRKPRKKKTACESFFFFCRDGRFVRVVGCVGVRRRKFGRTCCYPIPDSLSFSLCMFWKTKAPKRNAGDPERKYKRIPSRPRYREGKTAERQSGRAEGNGLVIRDLLYRRTHRLGPLSLRRWLCHQKRSANLAGEVKTRRSLPNGVSNLMRTKGELQTRMQNQRIQTPRESQQNLRRCEARVFQSCCGEFQSRRRDGRWESPARAGAVRREPEPARPDLFRSSWASGSWRPR